MLQMTRALWRKLRWKKSPSENEPGRPIIVIPPPQRRRPAAVDSESPDADESHRSSSPADDPDEGHLSLPSSPTNRDSPPDAVLRAMNSPPAHRQEPEQLLDPRQTSVRNDMQLSRRGTLLISESRRPGEQPVSPSRSEISTTNDVPASNNPGDENAGTH